MFALSAAILGTATVTATPTRPAVGTEWRRNDGMVSTHKKREKIGEKLKKSTEWRRNDGMESSSSSHVLLVGSKRSNPFFLSHKKKGKNGNPPDIPPACYKSLNLCTSKASKLSGKLLKL